MAKPDICIITTRNIFNSPCLEKYEKLLTKGFDILYWDRCSIDESCGAENYYCYKKDLAAAPSKFKKVTTYLGFVKYLYSFMAKSDYKKLIVFPTQTAWLLLPFLTKKYKGRYLLDIRDYAGEYSSLQAKLSKRVVECSEVTTLTSPAYASFLPKRDYPISHNVQEISPDLVAAYRSRERKPDEPVVLSFIGSVRFIDMQQKLIELFKNDSRFVLKFIGRGSEDLANYVKENGVNNVELVGRFERSELPGFYTGTDMAINVYGNNNPYLDFALSNKLYSAAIMGMPLLVSPDTYMAEMTEKYGFGIAVDVNDKNTADKVYTYYNSLDKETLLAGCDEFMKTVYEDERRYKEAIEEFMK